MRSESCSEDEAGAGVGHDEFVGHLFLHSSDESRAAAVHGDQVVRIPGLVFPACDGGGASELLLRKKRLRLLKLGSLAVEMLTQCPELRVVSSRLLLIT